MTKDKQFLIDLSKMKMSFGKNKKTNLIDLSEQNIMLLAHRF